MHGGDHKSHASKENGIYLDIKKEGHQMQVSVCSGRTSGAGPPHALETASFHSMD